jgi:hypothetical protein
MGPENLRRARVKGVKDMKDVQKWMVYAVSRRVMLLLQQASEWIYSSGAEALCTRNGPRRKNVVRVERCASSPASRTGQRLD